MLRAVIDQVGAQGIHIGRLEQSVSNLGDSVDELSSNVAALGAAIETEIQQLADQVAAGQDVTAQIDRIRDLSGQLQGRTSQLGADDPAAPPDAGT